MNYAYILHCADGTLYTGWTNDLERRLKAHNGGTGGKYTRARRPVELVYAEALPDTAGRLVTVTADVLNVRTGPGTGYAIQGTLRAGETVTVTAYRDTGGRTWGKLTTGGWICMEYVQG